jgi:hypothetical protein
LFAQTLGDKRGYAGFVFHQKNAHLR